MRGSPWTGSLWKGTLNKNAADDYLLDISTILRMFSQFKKKKKMFAINFLWTE